VQGASAATYCQPCGDEAGKGPGSGGWLSVCVSAVGTGQPASILPGPTCHLAPGCHKRACMQAIKTTLGWARTHERHLSALAMAGGFAFDSYAFGRIDRVMTQAVFILYLVVSGTCIAVLHRRESRGDAANPRLHTILVAATQFALGALLSGFCVFYIRSASLGASWPFLLFMAAIFIGNEYFRAYASRLVFAALLFFFALYSYAILLVPLVLEQIGPRSFLISGGLAVAAFFLYMRAIAWLGHDRYRNARNQIAAGMVMITVLMNAFYFLKVFPPLPLVLTDAGIFHNAKRTGNLFQVAAEPEPPSWQALFGIFPVVHAEPGAKLYLYNAIFAPRGLRTQIVHEWQWQDAQHDWKTQQRVQVPIAGGREDGFRFYSTKTAPAPGQWRVNIVTLDGRAIGRVRFSVLPTAQPVAVQTQTFN
jgi:Protein of unknown function (DUF2914)